MEIINWLNSTSGAITGIAAMITALATVVLVGITGFYAWVTKKMLEENRQMRIDAQKPEIAIYLRLEKEDIIPGGQKITVMNLYVDNIGMGPALEVTFDTDLSFGLPGNRSLEDVPFLQYGIRFLPPRQNRKYQLGHEWYTNNQFDELMQKQFEIKVTYKDSRGKKYKEYFYLNLQEH